MQIAVLNCNYRRVWFVYKLIKSPIVYKCMNECINIVSINIVIVVKYELMYKFTCVSECVEHYNTITGCPGLNKCNNVLISAS